MFEIRKGLGVFAAAALTLSLVLTGCGGEKQGGARPTAVKAMNVLRQEHVAQDYKTMLQEYVQGHDHETIAYEQVAESGPDHDKRFTMRVRIGTASLGEGTGRSKKEAEQHAAAAALERLRKR